jgi:hypothetical protein
LPGVKNYFFGGSGIITYAHFVNKGCFFNKVELLSCSNQLKIENYLMIRKIFLSVFLLLYTSACSTQQFRLSEKPAKSYPQYESSQAFFLYGIGQTKEVNASAVCNGDNKASEFATTLAPLDIVIGAIQGALILVQVYSPRTASVTCK